MSIADELHKLGELHRSGALTDEEFAQAKARVLGAARATKHCRRTTHFTNTSAS